MSRIFAFISVFLLLASCATRGYETVEIIGKDPTTSEIRIRGMGVRLPDGSILTSDHIVRDANYQLSVVSYQTKNSEYYTVGERDTTRDRARFYPRSLGKLGMDQLHGQDVRVRLTKVSIGDTIYTEVSRSGSIVRQVGKVVDPSGSTIGYDTTGRVVTLSGIVLTDLDLLPGDSGAPIYTLDKELIDVVHVR